MPQIESTSFLQTIRLARKRMIVGQMLDAVLLSLITFAAIAIPVQLIPPLHDLIQLLPFIGASILLVGLCIVCFNLPSIERAATKLDQINQTHDLLSTALFSLKNQDDWAQTILQIASHQSQSMKQPPCTGRFSPAIHLASWSGISGIMLIGMLLQNTSNIATADNSNISESISQSSVIPFSPIESTASQQQNTTENQLQEASTNGSSLSERISRSPGQSASASGTGQSDATFTQPQINTSIDQTLSHTPANQITNTSLSGLAAENPATGETSPGTVQTTAQPHLWDTVNWAASKQATQNQHQPSPIDPAYRELITDYFDR